MKRLLAVVIAACACAQQGDVPANTTPDSIPMAARTTADPPVTRADTTEAARPDVSGTSASAAQTLLRGQVVASGTEAMPFTTLQTTSGLVFLTGALEPELRALSSATVELSGAQTRRDTRVTVDVRSYDVIDIDGERPLIGRLLASNRLIINMDTLSVTGTINAPAGAKIWITGDLSGKQISVRSYGIISR